VTLKEDEELELGHIINLICICIRSCMENWFQGANGARNCNDVCTI